MVVFFHYLKKHDHWIDLTHEHTKTISFTYKIPFDIEAPFAYICVYNHGEESWVNSGRKYQLLYWDKNAICTLLKEKECKRDSFLVFENVPDGMLYKLVDTSSSMRRERIFSYEEEKQVWW